MALTCPRHPAFAVPIFLETAPGTLVNATLKGSVVPVPAALRSPMVREDLAQAQADLESLSTDKLTTAIALPADPMLWAEALTGLTPSELKCVDEGA